MQLVPVNECAPEVSKARRRAYERQRCAEQLKTTFLKKLNKTMINSLTLYADNLLCMDLCCWSVHDAIKLIGLEVCQLCIDLHMYVCILQVDILEGQVGGYVYVCMWYVVHI